MNCKSFTKWLCISYMAFAALAAVRPAGAQAQGWCEEKYPVIASTMDNRVSLPAVAANGDNVYIAYRQKGIKLIISKDRGKTWNSPIDVSGDLNVSRDPAIAVFGAKILLAWASFVKTDNLTVYQLYYSESPDGGVNWSEPKILTTTRDDAFSPRFLNVGEQAVLLWFESPLRETLGNVSTVQTPEYIDQLFGGGGSAQGGLLDSRRSVRARLFTSTFSSRSGQFSTPVNFDEVFGSTFPYIFNIYGPLNGKLYVVANQNQDIRVYESSDSGQNWSRSYNAADQSPFDPRMELDLKVVDNEKYAVWKQRAVTRQVPVGFLTGSVNNSKQLSPPHFVRSLPRLAHSDGDFHVVWESGMEAESRLIYMRTDDVPPISQIQSPDDPNLKELHQTFTWIGNDNISSTERLMYSYSVREGEWTQPQAQPSATIKVPPDGDYVFQVRAEDVAGNIQAEFAKFPFNTLQSAPDTTIENAPSPAQPVESRQIEIQFTGEDNTDPADKILYSAQADDGEWTEFAAGKSHLFDNLSNGTHVLRIRTRDTRGNVDPTPSECQVNIKVGLELVLGEKPPANTNADEHRFTWTAKDDKGGDVSIDCFYMLNDGEAKKAETQNELVLTGLEEGRYVITLWGVDPAGDRTPSQKYAWVVDMTPPETSASFTKEYRNGMPLIALDSNDPEVEGAQPIKPNKYEYRINDGEWTAFEHPGGNWPIPSALSFYSWGYQVAVRATDVAGNTDESPASVDLRIFTRTNPYIFYGVIAVLVVGLLFLIKTFMPRGGGARRPAVAASAASSSAFGSSSLDSDSSFSTDSDSSTSSYKFDDDDDDPYA